MQARDLACDAIERYERLKRDWVNARSEVQRADDALTTDLIGDAMRATEIRFLRGRLKFGGSKTGAPFPSVLLVYLGNGVAWGSR